MKLDVWHKSKCLFEAKTIDALAVKKTRSKILLKNACVTGRIRPKNWIPCFLESPNGKVLFITSGHPSSTVFDTVYFPEDDIALRFVAKKLFISKEKIEFAGPECSVEIVADYFRKNFNSFYKRFNKKLFPKAPVGWCSWYCFFGEFNEIKALKIAEFAAKNLKEYGFEYVQLETWCKNSTDVPVFNHYHGLKHDPAKFPHGMKYVADKIHEKGLKAGLWVVPLATGEESVFLKDKDMFLTERTGNPVKSWSGRYTLDPTHPKARKYIKNMLATINDRWSYDYVKIDGLELGGDPVNDYYMDTIYNRNSVRKLFYRKQKDPLRNIALLIRRAIGPKTFFTVCAAKENGKFVGIGNAARIGGDIFYEGEDPTWGSILHTAKITTEAYHVHNIFWYNDPDVLSIREPLPTNHARMLCTIVGLTGQLLFSGDILYELPRERVRMLQQLMPVCDIYPAHLAKNKKLQPVWNLVIKRDFEQWNVAGLFNWNEKSDVMLKVKMAQLGLDPAKEYLLYDFWNTRFIGVICGQAIIKLRKQSCKLCAIRERTGRPQILSTDRHITQGGVCIKKAGWDEDKLCLDVTMDLPKRETFTVVLYVPSEYRLKSVKGQAMAVEQKKNIVKLQMKNGRWKCCFIRDAK
ncbi:MAG: glycoside hydrolase family 36 protein [Planctomycetota bacterium]